MFGLIAVITGIFSVGFTFGYAMRDIISRRRHQRFLQRRDLDDAADHPGFIPDSGDFDLFADRGFVPASLQRETSGLPADAPQGGKLKSNETATSAVPAKG
jgi:hypothetical protein